MSYLHHREYRALVKAIQAAPDDDLPRLVAADWLDEHRQDKRAAFIRLCCNLPRARMHAAKHILQPREEDCPECQEYIDLFKWLRNDKLHTDGYGRLPFAEDCPDNLTREYRSDSFTREDITEHDQPRAEWVWHRGFVRELECTLAQFVSVPCRDCCTPGKPQCHGTARRPGYGLTVLPLHPVVKITLTDVRRIWQDRPGLTGRYAIGWPGTPRDGSSAVRSAERWMRKWMRESGFRLDTEEDARAAIDIVARAWVAMELTSYPQPSPTVKLHV